MGDQSPVLQVGEKRGNESATSSVDLFSSMDSLPPWLAGKARFA
jgi:hypothetical protein